LHSDGKGKLPDTGIIERIRALKGPIRLKTYISLSCENFPEVVQALNLKALIHKDFHHETIDGGIAQSEIESLGIQGVPSVMHNGKLLHSGKIQLIDLQAHLEKTFGSSADSLTEKNLGAYDVVNRRSKTLNLEDSSKHTLIILFGKLALNSSRAL